MRTRNLTFITTAGLVCSIACTNEADEPSPEDAATLAVKEYVTDELRGLRDSAAALQAAAPAPDADGWNSTDDAAATAAMRAAWGEARDHYERIEGAIAVLFPGLDVSTDERYDGFIEDAADDDLFDGDGVTGMHAIERIVWSDVHPQKVIDFESALPGYQAAAFPGTEAEARDFKTELCQRLVDDVANMQTDFGPLALDSSTAFRGVIGSIQEQVEKVTLAATAEDESRYSQRTLDDMRANLEGGRMVYAAFTEWVKESAGSERDAAIMAGFEALDAFYAGIDGAAIPAVPADFDPAAPSDADLATPYGQLWTLLGDAADPDRTDSLSSLLLDAADSMGIPQLPN